MLPFLKSLLEVDGMLWVSWPKKTASLRGTKQSHIDISENMIREIGLENGLVDVKVIAIDEKWSGLKFVYRIKDRN